MSAEFYAISFVMFVIFANWTIRRAADWFYPDRIEVAETAVWPMVGRRLQTRPAAPIPDEGAEPPGCRKSSHSKILC